ncbi:MAG: hypothetical protein C3F11_17845 [Methylocystaceae bacterium]|nr:MAG: hypothetical protein C3F11_17845 [Methylocystaceae bacterium]
MTKPAAAVRMLLRAVLPGAALLLAPCAMAEAPPPEAEQKPVQAFGADHPSCREWTDGCLVCARQADGSAACSTVGMACLPAAVACLKSDE